MRQIKFTRDKRVRHYAVEEAFKTIRANLLFCGTGVKTILITSFHAHEGKTTITTELGRSLSAIDKKVLLIDADLRKSTMMNRMAPDLQGTIPGMSQYLSGQAELEDVICHTQYPNLDVIFAGQCPPNPAELMGSERFKTLLDAERDEYDYVLIDTAPVGIVIDAAMISPICDGALLVVSIDDTNAKNAVSAKQQIEKGGCKILGVILNEARKTTSAGLLPRKNSYYYYYRRGHYGSHK